MNHITLEVANSIAIIRLDRGKANAINRQMVDELYTSFDVLEKDPDVKGVVISGKGEFFSAGLDVIELYQYNEQEINDFWMAFHGLAMRMFSFSKPLVAAITGHSPAGGCVLAVCADYRVMADGKYRIGLNEIPVGIVVPVSIFELYSFWLGNRKAYQFIMTGKLMTAPEALEAGLIDQMCSLSEVEQKAIEQMHVFLNFPAEVWRMSKQNLRSGLIQSLDKSPEDLFGATLKQWWAPETRQALAQVVASLKK